MCMSEVDSFRCLFFHFLTHMNRQFVSVTYRLWVSVSQEQKSIITKKTKLQYYWEQQAQLYTAIFLAISEAWIKYVKITFFWDVLPSSSQYKMPLPPWGWRQQIPQKCQYHFTKLHVIIFKETVILIVGAVRSSNAMLFKLLAVTLL